MRRLVPGLAVAVLMGVPIWIESSWTVGLVAAASGAICVVAVLRSSLALATTGGVCALLSLALALWQSSSPTNMLGPVLFGLALLLLADGTHLSRLYDGATVVPAFWRRRIGWWAARGAISLGIALIVAILAPLVAVQLPSLWGSFLAGFGVLAAFAAAVTFAWPNAED